jgi:hypothetical protein
MAADRPVLLSSAYLYEAAALGVKHPVHSDWFFDHAHLTNDTQVDSLARLQPAKVVLTQFDFYRGFEGVLDQLRKHPEWVEIQVRNLAVVRSPDATPSMRRLIQHVSWAPVIIDLKWKKPPVT